MDEKLDPHEEEMRRFQRVADKTIAAERRAREQAEEALADYVDAYKAATGESRQRRYLRPLVWPTALAAGAWQWMCQGSTQAALTGTGAAAAGALWFGIPGPGESRPEEPAAQPPPSMEAPAPPRPQPAPSASERRMSPPTAPVDTPRPPETNRPGAVGTGAAGETTDGADPRVARPTIAAPADDITGETPSPSPRSETDVGTSSDAQAGLPADGPALPPADEADADRLPGIDVGPSPADGKHPDRHQ